jgi:hypothetical protein
MRRVRARRKDMELHSETWSGPTRILKTFRRSFRNVSRSYRWATYVGAGFVGVPAFTAILLLRRRQEYRFQPCWWQVRPLLILVFPCWYVRLRLLLYLSVFDTVV